MPMIKTPDGGFYVSTDDFNVDYVENSITLVQQGGSTTTGVTSFNGRTGAVVPAEGDYTADQVGARPNTWTPSADDVGALPISGGTVTGPIILSGTPTQDNEAATKAYVDILGDTVNDILDGTEALPYLPDDYTVPIATNSTLGGVKIGSGINVSGDGTISNGYTYTLPVATADVLGGIKAGTGVSIESDGTLNVTQQQQSIPMASEMTLGGVKVGSGLYIEDDGTLEATAGLYRDSAAGIAFVGPSESKTIMLQKAYQVLYVAYMYISSTVVDSIATTPIYLNAGQNMTDQSSSHLTVSFDENGASFSATNLDSTIGIFMFYGGFQEKTS